MAFRLKPRTRFLDDIDDVIFYLAVKQSSPHATASFEMCLQKAYGRLKHNPFLYAISRLPGLESRGIRLAPVKGYSILYKVVGQDVLLLRLLHQRQDTSRAIFG